MPIDFSAGSTEALAYAVRFALRFGATLTLLHVVEPIATPDFSNAFPLVRQDDEVMAECRRHLDKIAEEAARDSKLVVRTLVRYGSAFDETATAARALKVDLIIIATHGYTGIKHVLLGSTTERVVRHAPCPVLVLRTIENGAKRK